MDEVSIEEARAKLGDIVDRARLARQATLITRHGKTAAIVAPPDIRLTELERRSLAEARDLCALYISDDVAAHTGEDDATFALAAALGSAQRLLGDLAAIVFRLAAVQEHDAGSAT